MADMYKKMGVDKKTAKPGDLINAANAKKAAKVKKEPAHSAHEKKEAKTYKGKSLKLGGGGRFEKLEDKLKSEGKSEKSAGAIAAKIGRDKLGKAKFQALAAKGKKAAK